MLDHCGCRSAPLDRASIAVRLYAICPARAQTVAPVTSPFTFEANAHGARSWLSRSLKSWLDSKNDDNPNRSSFACAVSPRWQLCGFCARICELSLPCRPKSRSYGTSPRRAARAAGSSTRAIAGLPIVISPVVRNCLPVLTLWNRIDGKST